MSSTKSTRADYGVQPTGNDHGRLEPITLVVSTGAARIQDYLTCGQARELGAALMACALKLEAAELKLEAAEAAGVTARTAFDEYVDGRLAEIKFIEVPDRLAGAIENFVGGPIEPGDRGDTAMSAVEWDDALGGGRN